jgi:hypothetical protein
MNNGFDRDEDELQHRQGASLYPVGRSLRATFPAPDGEDLQPRITTLMVELAHQPYEHETQAKGQAPRPAEAPAPSLLHQLTSFFRRTH